MIYAKLFAAFFKIGLFGFGGGMAIIQLIFESIGHFVSMTPSAFADIVAVAQVTPGPVAINTATYIGYVSAGILGSFVATVAVALPAFFIIAIVSRMVDKYKGSRVIQGALEGIRPATLGMIATALITIGTPAFLTDKPLGANISAIAGALPGGIDVISIVLCVATVVAIGKFKMKPFRVLIVMGCIGALLGV